MKNSRIEIKRFVRKENDDFANFVLATCFEMDKKMDGLAVQIIYNLVQIMNAAVQIIVGSCTETGYNQEDNQYRKESLSTNTPVERELTKGMTRKEKDRALLRDDPER